MLQSARIVLLSSRSLAVTCRGPNGADELTQAVAQSDEEAAKEDKPDNELEVWHGGLPTGIHQSKG
jgi:hypothetical protein